MDRSLSNKLTFLFVFLSLSSILIYYLNSSRETKIDNFKTYSIENRKNVYNSLINSFEDKAKIVFYEIMEDGEVLKIYQQLSNAKKDKKNKLREELYHLLKNKFNKYQKSFKIAQIHFHLPNSESFLRIHKPKKFGDSLLGIRDTVEKANQEKTYISGYEIGRNYGSYRFIFPIKDSTEKHYGTVEIPFSAKNIVDNFIENFNQIGNFHFSKELMERKVWEKPLSKKYKIMPLTKMYGEKKIFQIIKEYHKKNNQVLPANDKIFQKKIKLALKSNIDNEPMAIYQDTTKSQIVFIPILNPVSKELVGYFSSRMDANSIAEYNQVFYIQSTIMIIALALFLFLFYRQIESTYEINEFLKDKVQEQTLELQKTNIDLEEKNEIFSYLVDTTMEAIIISDKNNKILQVNQASTELFKIPTKNNFIGRNIADFVPEHESSKLVQALQMSYEPPTRYDLKKSDGTIFPTLASGRDVIFNHQKARISVILDLTEIKQQEQQIFMQSKMVAMGEMIGNIAHQWRQPLTTISTKATGSLFQKEMNLLTDETFEENMESINENAQYLSQTIDIFRNFIRGSKEIVQVDIKSELLDSLKITEGSLKNFHINVKTEIEEKELSIKARKGELTQVIINILNNAKDASNENKIETPLIIIKLEEKNNKGIISIEDNAGGIPEDIFPKIFDPYFTTKHQSQGTGLGLNMSYQIITESLGGKIYAKNTKDGAKFFIELSLSSV